MPVLRFAILAGIPERTYRRLLLPRGYRADRKSWAVLRRKVFRDPPTERRRVWQTDLSEFETVGGGIWRICAVIDYVTKYCPAVTVTPTGRGVDALACLQLAVAEATRLTGLTDLRDDRGRMNLIGPDGQVIGQIPAPIAVVSDNGSCFRGQVYAQAFSAPAFSAHAFSAHAFSAHAFGGAYPLDDPLLRHVRTRVRSPQTNGVIERFFGTLKYEHLYRAEITDGDALAVEVNCFRQVYNTIRPHQALDDRTPRAAYLSM
jgi:putative transposase